VAVGERKKKRRDKRPEGGSPKNAKCAKTEKKKEQQAKGAMRVGRGKVWRTRPWAKIGKKSRNQVQERGGGRKNRVVKKTSSINPTRK